MEKLKEFPHACVAFSDTATWGSHDTTTDTDVPSSSDELSFLGDPSEDEIDLDGDYVVHGGAGDEHFPEVNNPLPADSEEQSEEAHPAINHEDSSNPPKAENETCDADADEEPPPRPRSRKSRKRRWYF